MTTTALHEDQLFKKSKNAIGLTVWKDYRAVLTSSTLSLYPRKATSGPEIVWKVSDIAKITWFKKQDKGVPFELNVNISGLEVVQSLRTNSKTQTKVWVEKITQAKSQLAANSPGAKPAPLDLQGGVNRGTLSREPRSPSKKRAKSGASDDPFDAKAPLSPSKSSSRSDSIRGSVSALSLQSRGSRRAMQLNFDNLDELEEKEDYLLTLGDLILDAMDDIFVQYGRPPLQPVHRRTVSDSSFVFDEEQEIDTLAIDPVMECFSQFRRQFIQLSRLRLPLEHHYQLIHKSLFLYPADNQLMEHLSKSLDNVILKIQQSDAKESEERVIHNFVSFVTHHTSEFLQTTKVIFQNSNGLQFFNIPGGKALSKEFSLKMRYANDLLQEIQRSTLIVAWKLIRIESLRHESTTDYSTVVNHVSQIATEGGLQPSLWLCENFSRYCESVFPENLPVRYQQSFISTLLYIMSNFKISVASKPEYPEVWKSLFIILKSQHISTALLKDVLVSLSVSLIGAWEHTRTVLCWDPSIWVSWIVPLFKIDSSYEEIDPHKISLDEAEYQNLSGKSRGNKMQSVALVSHATSFKEELSALTANLLTSMLVQCFVRSDSFEYVLRGILKAFHALGLQADADYTTMRLGSAILQSLLHRLQSKQSIHMFTSNYYSIPWRNMMKLSNIVREFVFMTTNWGEGTTDAELMLYFEGAPLCFCSVDLDQDQKDNDDDEDLYVASDMGKIRSNVRIRDGDWDYGVHFTEEVKCLDLPVIKELRDVFKLLRNETFKDQATTSLKERVELEVKSMFEFETVFFDGVQSLLEIIEANAETVSLENVSELVESILKSSDSIKHLRRAIKEVVSRYGLPSAMLGAVPAPITHSPLSMIKTSKGGTIRDKRKGKAQRGSVTLTGVKKQLLSGLHFQDLDKKMKKVFSGKNAVEFLISSKISSDEDHATRILDLLIGTGDIRCVSHTNLTMRNDANTFYRLKDHESMNILKKPAMQARKILNRNAAVNIPVPRPVGPRPSMLQRTKSSRSLKVQKSAALEIRERHALKLSKMIEGYQSADNLLPTMETLEDIKM